MYIHEHYFDILSSLLSLNVQTLNTSYCNAIHFLIMPLYTTPN